MSMLRFFNSRSSRAAPEPATAPIARERLQILLAHERPSGVENKFATAS